MTSEVRPLLEQLVAIDSVNPDLARNGVGESEIATFVADWLASRGLTVELQETDRSGRPNVIATVPGSGGGRALMLNGHLDTVGLEVMPDGLVPRVVGDRLYGRGASDMKGGLAALMLAAGDVATMGLRGDVILTAVADEEFASIGTTAVVKDHRADAAIVAEPTSLAVGLAHKGFVWLEVDTEGTAAHGSLPDVGVDAIAKMGPILVGLEGLGRRLAESEGHPLLGTGSIHASLIEGGHEVSTYPAHCRLTVERRTVPPEIEPDVLAEIERLIADARRGDPALRASVRTTFSRRWLDGRPDQPIAQALMRSYEEDTGRRPDVAGLGYWTDAAILAAAGIPAIVFGPHGVGHHGATEWVDLPSVEVCRQVVAKVATDFCG